MQMADDWYTPKWVFDDLGIDFDLDVCAPKEKLEWIPAKKHFSIDVDGLSQQWGGGCLDESTLFKTITLD